ncbi:MAG: cell division ATP-binding protein FtsE [Candidatus Portnoybacteria bacterium RBG_13_40_8]|uniref:Cell division ATP-binding protein FtsE n=1 Tax=Candidatus Portnoybacteria bacterium RBG_13_40_8 TaxID=1801990 RepID=A0A1G2F4R8_9BACT|nr:MAG: cell division ATP-binding protein FtsE [Candidatus Portnoybacteria bacterium RBG_13_40_8]OGZ36089.1 MAG: cell division ATP-binding protein FtsE [Candidatus Portnoybacteria bacterium RIFCSPHIGHO2_01_FULL_39_19]
MIEFKNVSKYYPGDCAAIKDVTFSIRPKEFVSIVGRSGAGKTTLLRLLLKEEPPSEGEILVDGRNVKNIKSKELPLYRRKIGTIFQDFKLLPNKTAYENIAFAMEAAGRAEEDISEDVPQILSLVELVDKADNFPCQLSGGEKQRVAIGRALIHKPDILMADEPSGNLDPLHTWDIIRLLCRINELGTTVILATHDREIINALSKRVISLDRGRVIRDEENGRYIV